MRKISAEMTQLKRWVHHAYEHSFFCAGKLQQAVVERTVQHSPSFITSSFWAPSDYWLAWGNGVRAMCYYFRHKGALTADYCSAALS